MSIYITAVWVAIGLIIAVIGYLIWKKNLLNLALCLNKSQLKDEERFIEVYGKDVSFLGILTLVSALIGYGDEKYFTVAIAVNALAVVYFICEVIRLSKKFSK